MILLLSAFIATVIFLMLAFLFLHSSGEARGVKKRLGEYAGNQAKHDLSADRAEELKKHLSFKERLSSLSAILLLHFLTLHRQQFLN